MLASDGLGLQSVVSSSSNLLVFRPPNLEYDPWKKGICLSVL